MRKTEYCRTRGRIGVLASSVLLLYYLLAGLCGGFDTSVLWVWAAAGGVILTLSLFDLWWPRERLHALSVLLDILRGVICVLALVFFTIELCVLSGMKSTAPENVDYLLVAGALVNGEEPSDALLSRIDRAYAYLQENPNTRAILSGGQGVGEEISEAECMRRVLVSRGIAPERLILEDRSRTTSENMRFSTALVATEQASVAVVTSNFHLFRSVRLARAQGWAAVYGISAPFSGVMLPHYMAREFLTVVVDTLRGNM